MTPTPRWYTPVVVVALLWNILGLVTFVMDLHISPERLSAMTASQQAMYAARPAWATLATGAAVIGGTLGCIGLLMRRRWAMPLFVISLVGLVVQDAALISYARSASLGSPAVGLVQGLVFLVAIALLLLARRGIARQWLT